MNKVFAFGSNGSGQLGIGHIEDTNIPTPCLGLPEDDPVLKISGGGNHAAVLTQSGKIYMTGLSQFGEEHIKVLDKEDINWYRFQKRFDHIVWKDVVCGWSFTLLLSNENKLYGIGTSRWNELLSSSTDSLIEIAHHIDIVNIACGWRHVVVLDSQGQVYGWGWGKHGQLGPAQIVQGKKDIRSLQKIDMPQPITQVVCGHIHTLLKGQDGTVYGLGSNKYEQLGTGDTSRNPAVSIDAGWHHSIVMDTDGTLCMWGRDDHGQLGDGSNLQVKKIACGSEHTLAIDQSTSHVLAWGWNEHGNCASDKDSVRVPTIIDQYGPAYIVGAGCATSWFGILL